MPLKYVFWVLMILWFVFGLIAWWPSGVGGAWLYAPLGGHILIFALFAILGWRVFGPVIES